MMSSDRNGASRLRLAKAGTAVALSIIIMSAIEATPSVQAQTFTTLYTFTGMADGGEPYTRLIRDAAGNLYGTTMKTIFKLDTSGNVTTIHRFRDRDPRNPKTLNNLLMTPKGTFYGSSRFGGHFPTDGTVFKVSSFGKLKLLWEFSGEDDPPLQDGAGPSSLIRDAKGNFYGTTGSGGLGNCDQSGCQGTVFKIDLKAHPIEQILYTFSGGLDGGTPVAGLLRDGAGNLYGTTAYGGLGHGTVFKLDQNGKETVLYAFTGQADGAQPLAGVIRDSEGNLYGTTTFGGDSSCQSGSGCGVVFKLSKGGKQTILHRFKGGMHDGATPVAGLVRDSKGNLYGTTIEGGGLSCPDSRPGCGVVFKIDTSKSFTLLHAFTGGGDGLGPGTELILDSAGNLYGTAPKGAGTGCGGFGCGVIFSIAP